MSKDTREIIVMWLIGIPLIIGIFLEVGWKVGSMIMVGGGLSMWGLSWLMEWDAKRRF